VEKKENVSTNTLGDRLSTALAGELSLFLGLPDENNDAKAQAHDATKMQPWSYEPGMNEALYTLSQLAMMDFLIMTPLPSLKTTTLSLDSTTFFMNTEQ
jgi:hypothetical protein